MEDKNKLPAIAKSPFLFRLYLLYKLPAAFFLGIRIRKITNERSIVSVPFKWLTQNPFRSTYFASLAMAAEMSTGVLAMANVYKRKPAISMLVTHMEASYFKKAKGVSFFTCEQGLEIADEINAAATTSESKTITIKSTGRNLNNEIIAEFLFTWSFKAKSKIE